MRDDPMEHNRRRQHFEAPGPTGPREWHQQSHRALQTFDNVSVTGDARGHFGNIYHTYHNVYHGTRKRAPSTEDEEVTHTQKKKRFSEEEKLNALLESLGFDGMESRLGTISPAHAESCNWIFRTPQYLRWQDDAHGYRHHGLLWIKGHPGSGKSTLMKHALRVASENATAEIIVHFFFDAQGTQVLGRSAEGMYRSLLYQILQARPRLAAGLRMLASENWPTELLKNMLRNVVRSLQPEDNLTCYIDALDECMGNEIRDAVAFFEDIGDIVVTDNIRFRLCLSSRHFPHITMRKHVELKLDKQPDHLVSIVHYSRTKMSWLDLADSTMNDILTGIRDRCSGVFLWAALVIKILRERHDCGASHNELMHSLEQVPEGLDQLLTRILSNPDEALIACFQWVLFSGLSSVEQLYFAIKTSTGKLATGEWNRDAVDIRSMERFIVYSSRGFIESTYGVFRFIHESIEEYLRAGGLARLINIEQGTLKGASHSRMAQSCFAYLRLNASKYLPGSEQMSTFSDSKFPLLSHARTNALQYMEVAYQEGVLEPEAIWCVPLKLLVCAINCRSQGDYSFRPIFNEQIFFQGTATLLYLLLKSHCRGLAKTMLICHSGVMMNTDDDETRANVVFDIDAICGREYSNVLSLAVYRSDIEMVQILLGKGAAVSGRVDCRGGSKLLEHVMLQYYRNSERVMVPGDNRVLVRAITSQVCLSRLNEIAKLLLDRGAPIDEWLTSLNHSPLYWAALSSNIEMVRILLEHGANVDTRHDFQDTPLMGAARRRPIDEMVIETLLRSGADVNVVTSLHNLFSAPTALIFACETDQENVIRLLLRYGANLHRRTKVKKSASFEEQGYRFKPDGTAVSVALAKRNVN